MDLGGGHAAFSVPVAVSAVGKQLILALKYVEYGFFNAEIHCGTIDEFL